MVSLKVTHKKLNRQDAKSAKTLTRIHKEVEWRA